MKQQQLNSTKNTVVTRSIQPQAIAQHSIHPIEQLQSAIGNRAVNQLLANQPIVQAKPMFKGLSHELVVQPKLTIGAVGDKYEQEADFMAEQVVSQMNSPENSTIQRQELLEEEDDDTKLSMKPIVQRLSDTDAMAATPDLETSIEQERGRGQPLANTIRQPMERSLGADFSGVKVHTDDRAHQLNRSIQAKAFTTGKDIFFKQGEYNPGSRGGQELIAHELTHVVQQNGGKLSPDTNRTSTGNSIVQMKEEDARVANPLGAKLHKSNRKKVARGTESKIRVRSPGKYNTGIKATIPDKAAIKVDFAKTAEDGIYVWAKYNRSVGYISITDVAESSTKWRNHQQANIHTETTGFLVGIGADPTSGFNLPQGNLTVGSVPALTDFSTSPITSMTAPENLTKQQRRFLGGRLTGLSDKEVYKRGFIIRYQEYPKSFHRMIKQGPVLWTLDVDDILSIGSPENNKHAVVAGGKDVWAAGEARLKSAIEYHTERGELDEGQLILWGDIQLAEKNIKKLVEMGETKIAQKEAKERDVAIEKLGGQEVVDKITKIQQEFAPGKPTVVLDFGSGHYAPRGAWKKAANVWKLAGFQVEWDSKSQWV
jgi:hypothetical protein